LKRDVLTIFLASPSDLEEERKKFREVVNDFNSVFGKRVGWQIELLVWEDTLPGCDRPQSIINKDVDYCELFIGMIWKRWGQTTGEYSSGFEEEFVRARNRREKTDKPEIWLLFKKIDEEQSRDPGEQLKKVFDFQHEQIQKKELMFKEFRDTAEFEKLIYKYLIAYVLDLSKETVESKIESKSISLESSKLEITKNETEYSKKTVSDYSDIIPLFEKVQVSLKKEGANNVDFWDRSRLLLTASSWFSEKHSGEIFGGHETNLAYVKRKEWKLSGEELRFLVRTMVGDINNVLPGWY